MSESHYFIAPPYLAECLLNWTLPDALKEPVIGDLSEEYQTIYANKPMIANYWFIRQAIKTSLQYMSKTQRGFLMFTLSLLIFFGLTYMAMYLGGGVHLFIDIPSFLLVLPPALFFTMAATSGNALKTGLKMMFNDNEEYELMDYLSAGQSYRMLGNSALLLGGMTSLLGWVAMSANIGAEEFGKVFGPAFAVSVLTIIYGFIIKILCYVVEQKVYYQMQLAQPEH